MARTGVDFFKVSVAAKNLQGRGLNPTVDLVRAELGTGSKSTIGPLLKRWKVENLEAANAEALPEELTKIVRTLMDQMQQAADVKVDEMAGEFQEQKNELVNELKVERQLTDKHEATIKELESHIEKLSVDNSEIKQSLDNSKLEAAKQSSELSEVRIQLQDSKNQVSDLKEEVKQVKESREHYQKRAADDREQEREQFRSNKILLEGQITDLNTRLTVISGEKSRLEEQKQQVDELARSLQENIDTINSEREKLRISVSTLKHDNTRLNSEIVTHLDKIKKVETLFNEHLNTTNDLKASNQVLESVNKNNEKKIEELDCTFSKVADENKELIAENSRLFGEFKQLEVSYRNCIESKK